LPFPHRVPPFFRLQNEASMCNRIHCVFDEQRAHFASGVTKTYAWRLDFNSIASRERWRIACEGHHVQGTDEADASHPTKTDLKEISP
jgi:hypothetical protein